MDNFCFEDTSDSTVIVRERAKARQMISKILVENGEETSWDDVI